jgi:sigma-54 dependent transcriptional regulator, acetoin dehydrogenase operon transcriptional activator AcoR
MSQAFAMNDSANPPELHTWDFDPSKRQPELLMAWKQFVTTGQISGDIVPTHIAESWQRSRDLKVDPFQFSPKARLKAEQYRQQVERSRWLNDLAFPIIRNLFESFGASRYIVSLYDAEGYHLIRLAQPQDLHLREQHGLVVGICYNEPSVGTAGFNLASRLRRSVRMIGCEHYLKTLHHISGVYAPIIEQRTQMVVGVIAVGGAVMVAYPQAESIVVAASTAIENLIELDRVKTETFIYSRSLQMTVDSLEDGIIVTDQHGKVREVNRAARQRLGIDQEMIDQGVITERLNTTPLKTVIDNALRSTHPTGYQSEVQLGDTSYLIKAKTICTEDQTAHGLLIQLKDIRDLSRMLHHVTDEQPRYTLDSIVGSSAAIREIKHLARTAARTEAPVIIEGESGTGKEIIAQAIHNAGSRKWKPFVAINCAAIPSELIESIIFGHKKGAFTGAVQTHIGKFELAHEGTLFLDEIGEMPLTMQAKMLRAIEEGRIERVGGDKSIVVNVRIVSASNQCLLDLIHQNRFRQDLFYRLNVFRITIPALRERIEDIDDLVRLFVSEFASILEKPIPKVSTTYSRRLVDYDWPGNVRELRNAVQYSMARLEGGTLRAEHLNGFFLEAHDRRVSLPDSADHELRLSKLEMKTIQDVLIRFMGNKTDAAKALGISRTTLYRKLKTNRQSSENVS